jgi:thiol:disulfide interchange protein
MNKLVIGGIGAIVIVSAAIFYLLSNGDSQNPSSQPLAQAPNTDNSASGTIPEGSDQQVDASDNPISQDSNTNRYPAYSNEVLASSSNKRRVLFFYANWCPTCKVANDEFSANPNGIPEGVVLIRANYNDTDTDQDEKALAQKYNITYQHTFVEIDGQGNEVKKWNGGGLDDLIKNLN